MSELGLGGGKASAGGEVLPGSASSEAHLDSVLCLGHLQSLQQTSEQHLHEGLKESPFLETSEETAQDWKHEGLAEHSLL